MTPASADPLALQPLSTPQREIWFDQMLHEGVPLYNIGGYVDLPGRIDPVLFEKAVNLLVQRHDNLRLQLTAERDEDGLPLQRFAEPWPVRVPVVDVSGEADPVAAAHAFMRQRFEEPFTLEGQPLFRYDLIKLAEDHYSWLMQYHHLIVDGWAIALLNRSLAALYSDLAAGCAPELETPSYASYIADDQVYLESAKFEQQRVFWRNHHPHPPEPLLTPHYRRQFGGALAGSSCEPMTLSRPFYDRLGALAEAIGASRFHVLLGALYVYFARTGQRDEVTFGLPVLNRANAAYKQTAGLFANLSPVRFACGRDLSFAGLLESISATLKSVYRHQRFPASNLRRAVGADASSARMFDVGLSYENHDYEAAFGAIDGRCTLLLHSWEQTPLQLFVRDFHAGADVRIDFVYNQAFFTADEIRAFHERFRVVLEAAVSDPHGSIASWPILPEAERQLVLKGWNITEAEYPNDQCIHQLFEAQAERTPEAIALVFEEQSLTYAELNARANRLAHHLIGLGLRPDDRVAIGVERSLEMVVGLLAILKAGGAYVPLDPAYPEERLAFMVEDSAPVALLVHGATRERFAALGDAMPMVDLEADAATWAELSATNPDPAALGLRPNHLAYVIYTSGSTGKPKGVMVEHRGVAADCLDYRDQHGLTAADRVLLMAETSVDASVEQLFPVLFAGGRVILNKFDLNPIGFSRQLHAHGVSLIDVPAVYWRALVQTWLELPDLMSGSMLRVLIVGGDVMPVEVLPLWWQTFLSRSVRLFNVYGPTETTVSATSFAVTPGFNGPRIPIGRPLAKTRIYVLGDDRQPMPIGVAGEIHIGGAGVARGYLNRPELTAERFLPDPYAAESGARMYRTGDLARWLPDGNLEYIGRADFQVKIRGFRIEPGEIEAALRGCEGIQDAVVLAREDAPGEKRLVAYVTTDTSDRVAGSAARVACSAEVAALPALLKAQLRSSLPEHMAPAAFVVLEALPLTPNGKVDRKALPAPEADAYATRSYAAPEGVVEETLAELWSELLGVERVGRHDDFFALGGHSLLAVQVISRLRISLGVEVSLAELFARPVLAELAAGLAGAPLADGGSIALADRNQPLPLSFAQQRLWFLAQLEGPSATYNIPLALRLNGALNAPALRAALDRLVVRHEVLRTTFLAIDGEPRQRIVPETAARFALIEQDLRATADGEAELARWLEWEGAKPFDLEEGPLARGRLLRLGKEEHALLLTFHHAIADGWSTGVLGQELAALYGAFRQDLDDPLPPLAIQYADYAVWERQWVAGTRLQRQAGYWKSALAGAPVLLELPTDRPRPPEQDYVGAMVPVVIDAELTGGLKALARRHGATLFQVLLAGFAVLLSRLSGQGEVVIGSPSARRSRAELEGLIGFFVNMLVLRIDTAGTSVAELIERVKEQTLAAQAHEDLPFEQVVELLQPPRSLAHAPLFQVMFAWQNTPEASLELPGLEGVALAPSLDVAKFDLTLALSEANAGIEGGIEYATALFDRSTVERWVGHWRTLLRALVEASGANAVGRLPLLSEAERHLLLRKWNATQADYPQGQCVHELVEAQAERTPEAIALEFEEQSLNYAELNARANRLAHQLIAQGVRPDDRVAIAVERSMEMVVGVLAILKAGGAYVPLDPSYPEERLAFMVEDSAPVALLVHGATRERLAALAGAVPMIDLEADGAAWLELSASNPEPAALGLRPNHLAYVIYTSGSTGKPKGVMVEHGGVAADCLDYRDQYGLTAVDQVWLMAEISVDASVEQLFPVLLAGGSVILTKFDLNPIGFSRQLTAHGVSLIDVPAVYWRALVQTWLEQPDLMSGSVLRIVIVGGDVMPVDVLVLWWQLPLSQTVRLFNVYGPTETTVSAAAFAVTPGFDGPRIPIGRPLANTWIYVLDGDGQPVPIGAAGEMSIGGAGVARGYLNRPELTAQRFLPDPFAAESDARMYRTGDLARWLPDGNLEFLGRADFQVKIRGFRIELGEIEAALRACQGIHDAVVLAREDAPGEKRLVAYVTVASPTDVAGLPAVLKAHLQGSLAAHMVPSAFVMLEALPFTPTGKVDRKALPAPDAEAYATRPYAPPEGVVEETLAELWSVLLGIKQVGRHDDFFSLGGHSLLAVSLVEQMRRQGLPVDVRALFITPTLADLAAVVGDAAEVAVAVPPNRIPLDCTRLTPELLPLVSLEQAALDRIVATVPGGAANVQDIYPLGPLQEGLLFHHLLQREGDAYVLAVLYGFDTRERLENFLCAFEAVIARHDIFRTSFAWEGLSEPVQVVWRKASLPIEEVAFGPEVMDVASALLERFDPRRQRLDPRVAPLFHAAIAEDTSQGRWLLLLRDHHLVADHTTLEVLFEEIGAHQRGRFAALPAPLPYRNHIAQARLGLSAEAHTAFFQELLGEVDEPTAPFGLVEVRGDGAAIEESRCRLEPGLATRLRQQARRLGVTPASLFHLAFARVLAATSGRCDVVFGTVLFGRLKGGEGADRMPGLFINTLPVRIEVGEEGVEAAVRRTHRTLAGLLRHEHAPLTLAQRCSGVAPPAPLFSALLNYRHSPEGKERVASLMGEGIEMLRAEERTNYPLTVSVDDLGEGFFLTAQTLPQIGAERLCGYLVTAIDGLVAALESTPASGVRELAVLPKAERQQLLDDWNATEAEYPKEHCVHQLVEAQAERTPEATVLVFEEQSLSYAELNARANRLAHHLIALGIRPDDRVAIGVERSLEMVVGVLAILKAGGAYVPLDPSYPEERLAFMLIDSAPVALLVHAATRERLAALAGAVPTLDLEADAPTWALLSAANPDPAVLGLRANHLAYVIYTSGSTGRPKGVMVEHRGVCNLVAAAIQDFDLGPDSRVLQFASVSFDACAWEVLSALSSGAILYLPSPGTTLVGAALAKTITRHRLTHATLAPSVLATLPDGERFSTLGTLISGGERLPEALARRWAAGRRLINAYGPTESTVCATLHRCCAEASADPPIGRPIANTRIYVLDGEGKPAPIGVAGEIHIGGAGVARGYLNRPELTAERFLPDPFVAESDARMYRTGDLARWLPDGTLEFLGRVDFQVKMRGLRIELGEIESALMGCEGVREAVVLAREDGAGEKRLVAYVTTDPAYRVADRADSATGNAEVVALPVALKAQLRSSLPDYMVPAAFVVLEAMPLTPNGKLDRKALSAPGAEAYATGVYAPPEGPLEEALAALWAGLLKQERVGRYDDFFVLGGHSLLAVQVISRLRSSLGLEVTLAELFARPVLAEFAAVLAGTDSAEGGLIPAADRSQPLPLSFAQRRLWFLGQLEGPSPTYNIPLAWRLAGDLDPGVLRGALDQLVVRHEALRTTFTVIDGEPVQRIVPETEAGFALIEHDLGQRADAEAELLRWLEKEAAEPFDLEAGPLVRGRLFQLGEREHALLLTLHHAIADGWSLGVLSRELDALYCAIREGMADPLPPLPIQYADYAVWERQWMANARLQRQAAYWQSAMAGAPVLLELPTDRPRPAVQDYIGAMVPVVIDREFTIKLKALAQRHGASLFQVLLAGFAALLSRLSGQEEVVIGSPSAHRSRTELEGLIGFFVNTLALRIDTASANVGALIARAKDRTLAAQAHEDLPFEQVVELLQPPRSLAHAPLFQVMFAWQNTPEEAFALSGMTAEILAPSSGVAKFDLTLSLAETEEGIEGVLDFATALFDQATVERWLGYWRSLLEGLVQAPDATSVARLPLLNEAERQHMLEGWNATAAEYPKDQCIHQLFEAQAQRTPEAVALVFEEQSLSYAQLNARANGLAYHLIAQGVRPDDRVAIAVERSVEMVVGMLGILKAGGAYVPLDPAYPEERLAFMVDDSAPVALLVHGATRERFAALAGDKPLVDLDADGRDWAEVGGMNPDPAILGLGPNHLAYVIYTSGSTGKPKGVMNEHRGIVNRLVWMQAAHGLGADDAVLQKTPCSFDVSVWEFFWPLLAGARLVMARPEGHKDPGYLVEVIGKEGITTVHFVPQMLQVFLEHPLRVGFPSLRRVFCSGEALAAELVDRFHTRLPASELHNLYGPTEAAVDVTAWDCSQPVPVSGTIPIGRPIANTRIYVLDEQGDPVPPGVAGELFIGGVQVARGYLNQPELTSKRFLTDPYSADPDARMYRTGDLARWLLDGNLEYIGRVDFQVKIRGLRIELGEIESVLRGCVGIREAVVSCREDVAGEKRLVAYVTAKGVAGSAEREAFRTDAALLPAELKAELRRSLPEYMVPAAFVVLERLPLTPNGKLDRKALPAPESDDYATGAYASPEGAVEEALASLWSELLGMERVGRHDDFFSLGGHSLLALQVISRLRSSFGLEVTLAELFARPVLAEFASGLAGAVAAEGGRIRPADRSQPLPLSFAQRRLWFLAQLEGPSATYTMPLAWRLVGELDPGALRGALDQLVVRHEALRTTFVTVEGEPVQRIVPPTEAHFALSEHDLGQRPDAEAELVRWLEKEAAEPFDLEAGPLIRGRLMRLAEREHALLLTLHHAIADGWSVSVLGRELGVLYGAMLRGEADPLPELPIQYADYAVWERQWVPEERLQSQAVYWQSALAGAPVLLELPTDRPRPAVQDYIGALVPVVIDTELTGKLKALARRHGATLFQVLLAGFAALLSRLSGQGEVVIGSPSAHRPRTELEGLIGFFVNTLALRIDTSSASVGELIARAKERTLAAQAHEDLPFEQVVELLQPPRSLAQAPLFQAMFAWQNTPESVVVMPGLVAEALEGSYGVAKFDLTLSLEETGEGIEGGMDYATALFDRATVERWVGHLRTLLEGLVEASEATDVSRLPLLSEAEQQLLLREWNATEADYPSDQCVHQLVEAQAERTPEAVALVFEEQSLSYAELNIRANRLAHQLMVQGVRPDDRVAIAVQRSVEMVVGVLAILKAGGGYVPLDPAYPEERLAFMLEDSAPVALLVHGATRERFAALSGGVPLVDLDAVGLDGAEPSATNPNPSALGLRPNHLAYVIYTSGSTGKPKGVMVEHGGFVNLVTYCQVLSETGKEKRVLQFASLSFDVASREIFTTLSGGDALHLVSSHQMQAGVDAVLQSKAITHAALPPAVLATLDQVNLPDLVYLTTGGEACSPALVARWARGRRLVNAYGPTEATVCTTVFECRSDGQKQPIGRPIANTRIYLLDGDGQPVPIGVAGEIHIGGVGVARGYLNQPELTAERFLPDPYTAEPDARMYRTGDLARWRPDGNVEFLGRADFQVKIRGFRIELGEIEAVLRVCDGIREAVVLAREDGVVEKRLVAYVAVDKAADNVDAANLPAVLKAHLQSCLPSHMVPAAFVVLEALPLTPNGKLDRKALPAPEAEAYASGAHAPPEGPVEESLAELWSELLGIKRVGRHDDFFSLGGHSLLVLRLLSEINQTFSVRLPVGAVFLRPTLAGLAEAVDDARLVEEAAALVPLQPEGDGLPLFLLPGAFGSVLYLQPLAKALGTGRPVLALPSPGLDGRPPLASVRELALHHLRAVRRWQPKGPYFLAGHSSGGRVAFELARQLEQQGETVASLVILDTTAPDPGQDRPERTERDLLVDLVAFFEELAGTALGISREAIFAEPAAEEAYAKVMAAFQTSGLFFSRSAAVAELKALVAVYRAALGGHDGYGIEERVRVQIHLLMSRDRGGADAVEDHRPAGGWAARSEQGAVVDEVPGTHITMVALPHVAVLAERLAGILSAADGSAAVPAEPASQH